MIVNGEGEIEIVKMIKQEEDENSWETISEAETIPPPSEFDLDEDQQQNTVKYDFAFEDEIIAEEKLKGRYPDLDTENQIDDPSSYIFGFGQSERARPTSPDSEGFPVTPEWSDNEYEHVVECGGSVLETLTDEIWTASSKSKRKRKKSSPGSAETSKRVTRKSRSERRKLSSLQHLNCKFCVN